MERLDRAVDYDGKLSLIAEEWFLIGEADDLGLNERLRSELGVLLGKGTGDS